MKATFWFCFTHPEIWLPSSPRSIRSKNVNVSGIAPVSWLNSNATIMSDDLFWIPCKKSSGIGPRNLFEARSNSFNFSKFAKDGSLPSKVPLVCLMERVVRPDNRNSSVGKRPWKWFSDSSNFSNEVRIPISEGIVPVRKFPYILSLLSQEQCEKSMVRT